MVQKRVSIQDIADKLGLSKFSVSRALSGKPGVSESTRQRVLRAAHGLGYRTSHEIVSPTGQILFVRQDIDPVTSELWIRILHGAEREGERLGFAIVARHARFLDGTVPMDGSVVGLILAVPRAADFAGIATRTGLPVACASYVDPLEPVDQVTGADWEAGVAVAQLLTGLEHRRMAFVHGNAVHRGRAERLRGFADAIGRIPNATVDDLVFNEERGFREAFLAYLRRGSAPTAFFCAHDGLAVSLLSELLRLGVRVPDEVSVVGFNDFVAASQVSPRLTTVRTPQIEIGATMVRCIASRLAESEGSTFPPVRIALASDVVVRESTGRAGDGDWPAAALAAARRSTIPA